MLVFNESKCNLKGEEEKISEMELLNKTLNIRFGNYTSLIRINDGFLNNSNTFFDMGV